MSAVTTAVQPIIRPEGKFDFRKRLPVLDGLRGIAILAVFFFHYAGGFHGNGRFAHMISFVLDIGWAGVDLFFVLSGFLITGILFDTRNDGAYYKNFYGRRALRIFPIYYLLVAIYAFAPLGAHWRPGHLAFLVYLGYPAALIWPSLVQVSPSIRITHLWSLSVEEQFYLAWPWTVAKLRTEKRILAVTLCLGLLALLLRIGIWYTGWLDSSWSYGFLLCRMDDLSIGAAISILMRGSFRKRLERLAPALFVSAAGGVLAVFFFRHTTNRDDALVSTLGYTLIGITSGSLSVSSLIPGICQKLLSFPVLRTFGQYSYGMYLYHFPLSVWLSPLRVAFVRTTNSFLIGSSLHLLSCLLLNLGVAALSFHLIESPIMRLKNRFKYVAEAR